MKKLLALTAVLLLAASLSYAQGSSTGKATLNVTVGPEAGIVMGTTTALTSSSTFADYTASTALTYYIRTSTTGSITLQVTQDFACGGGPCVTTPPTSGDALTYTTSGQQPGTTGTATYYTTAQTASTGSATPVVGFGSSAQSAKTGNSTSVAWDLTNDPAYKAGSYSATVTFTISAS